MPDDKNSVSSSTKGKPTMKGNKSAPPSTKTPLAAPSKLANALAFVSSSQTLSIASSKPPSITSTKTPSVASSQVTGSTLNLPTDSNSSRMNTPNDTTSLSSTAAPRKRPRASVQITIADHSDLDTDVESHDVDISDNVSMASEHHHRQSASLLEVASAWEHLHNIRIRPVPMMEKRQLKARLENIPKLHLKGLKRLSWEAHKAWKTFQERYTRLQRKVTIFERSLRTIEIQCGTGIVNVFLFIKWSLFLNLVVSIFGFIFIIVPYVFYVLIHWNDPPTIVPGGYQECKQTMEGKTEHELRNKTILDNFLRCCETQYQEELTHPVSVRGSLTDVSQTLGLGSFEQWPVSYAFYHRPIIDFGTDTEYHFDTVYVIFTAIVFISCLVLMVQSMAAGVTVLIQHREGEFYKYAGLIFCGWEHSTNHPSSAAFKRHVLKNEMKNALQTEKKKINDLLQSRRQKMKTYLLRVFVNAVVICSIIGAGMIIFYSTLTLTRTEKYSLQDSSEFYKAFIGFVPSLVISTFNIIFPLVLSRLGKLEHYSKELETTLVLIRALFIRLFSVFAASYGFMKESYCEPKVGYCIECEADHDNHTKRRICWEAQFADQAYRLILTDLIIKCFLTFLVDPLRRVLKHYVKHAIAQRIGNMSFNVVRHSLDVIYIQLLSWMSFYFAPMAPLVVSLYCLAVFYIKKFSVLYNCKSAPDTLRTTRSTTMFMIAKIISFIAVLLTYVYIIGYMVPSRECGPFRGYRSSWDAVMRHVNTRPAAKGFFMLMGSPGMALPIILTLVLLGYYYYSVAQANQAMTETLRHLLILEGHDKQYLFSKLNSLRRNAKNTKKTSFKDTAKTIANALTASRNSVFRK